MFYYDKIANLNFSVVEIIHRYNYMHIMEKPCVTEMMNRKSLSYHWLQHQEQIVQV